MTSHNGNTRITTTFETKYSMSIKYTNSAEHNRAYLHTAISGNKNRPTTVRLNYIHQNLLAIIGIDIGVTYVVLKRLSL